MSGMSVRRFGTVMIFACVLVSRSVLSLAQAPATPSVGPAIYMEEQATRGAAVFSSVCVDCHARKDFSDEEFKGKWRGRTAFDLFDRLRSTMPESNPGSLERGSYIDLVAYIAKLNALPAGTVALPDDEAALKKQILALPSTAR